VVPFHSLRQIKLKSSTLLCGRPFATLRCGSSGTAVIADAKDTMQVTCLKSPQTGCVADRKDYVVPICMPGCQWNTKCLFADLQRGVCPDNNECDELCASATVGMYASSDTCSATGGVQQNMLQRPTVRRVHVRAAECANANATVLRAQTSVLFEFQTGRHVPASSNGWHLYPLQHLTPRLSLQLAWKQDSVTATSSRVDGCPSNHTR